jgi:FKBP-type peptidyl-prolyl cis-trans isomerase FklB
MKRSILVMSFSVIAAGGFAQAKKATTPVKTAVKPAATTIFKNTTDSVSYAIGVRIAQNLKAQGMDGMNLALLQKAMSDVAQSKTPVLSDAVITQCIGEYQQKVVSAKTAAQQKENAAKAVEGKKEGAAFLAANGKRAGVITLPSGLQYEVIKTGTDNTRPKITSTIKCHYTGTLINGEKFDSSVDRGTPLVYPLGSLVRGWQEALQLMTVGSKWKLYIPSELGYGDNQSGIIYPGATLIFEIELLGVEN